MAARARRNQTKAPAVPPAAGTYFITGYPGFLGRKLVEHIVRAGPSARVFCLVQPKFLKEAQRCVGKLSAANVELISGDVVDMHLGLSGEEFERVRAEVTDIFHLAAIQYLGAPRELAWRVNVDGTKNVIELARECGRLRRLNHFSTCYVSGDRLGVVCEDELDCGQQFRNDYEETKFQAEKLLERAAADLPISIYRPSSVVGDSHTGEIDRFDGPYYLAILLVTSPLTVPLPLPGDGVAPLNVVPVDYLVGAVWALSKDPRAIGRTFHLVDPNPTSTRRAYESVAEQTDRQMPRFNLPAKAADVMLRLPWLEKIARPQRAAIHYANHLAFYNCQNTLELLQGTGIHCPPLQSYIDRLIAFARERMRRAREQSEIDDPLDEPGAAPKDA